MCPLSPGVVAAPLSLRGLPCDLPGAWGYGTGVGNYHRPLHMCLPVTQAGPAAVRNCLLSSDAGGVFPPYPCLFRVQLRAAKLFRCLIMSSGCFSFCVCLGARLVESGRLCSSLSGCISSRLSGPREGSCSLDRLHLARRFSFRPWRLWFPLPELPSP